MLKIRTYGCSWTAGANLEVQWASIRLDKIIKGLYNKR